MAYNKIEFLTVAVLVLYLARHLAMFEVYVWMMPGAANTDLSIMLMIDAIAATGALIALIGRSISRPYWLSNFLAFSGVIVFVLGVAAGGVLIGGFIIADQAMQLDWAGYNEGLLAWGYGMVEIFLIAILCGIVFRDR